MLSTTSRTPGPAIPEPAAVPRQRAGRDPFFDNAKYLAIVLVAMGHAWAPLPNSGRIVETLYTFVFTFHMPVFILIAGYFSRNFDLRPERVWKLVTSLAVPYAIFEIAYTLLARATVDPDFPLSPLTPYWLMWFLPALFIWRLTTPIWQTIRWPLAVSLGIAAMASVSNDIGGTLQLQRVLQFMPFYVLGLLLRPEHFAFVRRRSVRIASVPVVALALLVAYWAVPRMSTSWFFRRYSAESLGEPAWTGVVMTLILFGCAVVLCACFLSWVPGKRTWMTGLGAATLYGYLLHGFVLRLTVHVGLYNLAFFETPPGRIAVTLASGVMVTLLCTPPVRRALHHVMEPTMDWARKRTPANQAR